jgi:CDI immunity proteins
MAQQVDLSQTLTELEHDDWGEPNYPSSLVTTCHALRYKPLRDFTPADLETMISQNISMPYLVPLALEHVRMNAFAEAQYYPGDLLLTLLRGDPAFWESHPWLGNEVRAIAQTAQGSGPDADDLEPNLTHLLARFLGTRSSDRVTGDVPAELPEQILQLWTEGEKLGALVLYMDAMRVSAYEARLAVERIIGQS